MQSVVLFADGEAAARPPASKNKNACHVAIVALALVQK
jgi:hypothetical protein